MSTPSGHRYETRSRLAVCVMASVLAFVCVLVVGGAALAYVGLSHCEESGQAGSVGGCHRLIQGDAGIGILLLGALAPATACVAVYRGASAAVVPLTTVLAVLAVVAAPFLIVR